MPKRFASPWLAAALTLFNYGSILIKTAANSIEIQNYKASVLDFVLDCTEIMNLIKFNVMYLL